METMAAAKRSNCQYSNNHTKVWTRQVVLGYFAKGTYKTDAYKTT